MKSDVVTREVLNLCFLVLSEAIWCVPLQMPPPTFKFRCWDRARPGTFFARDNVYNFLQFCRLVGCQENFLFETDGLGKRGVVRATTDMNWSQEILFHFRAQIDPGAVAERGGRSVNIDVTVLPIIRARLVPHLTGPVHCAERAVLQRRLSLFVWSGVLTGGAGCG